MGDVWLDALSRVRALGMHMVVPGHGEVLVGNSITSEIVRIERILERAIISGCSPENRFI